MATVSECSVKIEPVQTIGRGVNNRIQSVKYPDDIIDVNDVTCSKQVKHWSQN